MPLDPPGRSTRGVVVAHVPHPGVHATDHERLTLLQFARRLAALMGFDDAGMYDPSATYPTRPYFVPADTLTAAEAAALGIRGPGDLFGGVVPHAFVATKAISHPLVEPGAAAVAGWNPQLAPQLGDAVLAGFCAFTPEDARKAGLRLLATGPLRIKPVRASGGRGQAVVRDAAGLDAALQGMDPAEVQAHGVVLEEDVEAPDTYSVGQVRVADLVASYFGTQKLTPDLAGRPVFGGSDLTFARGDFDALLTLDPPPEVARAIELARRYDTAVRACYPGFYASRTNYDVLVGRDAAGRRRMAVLEQSWRAGGATGAEIAALEVLRAEPHRRRVSTSCVEAFGDSPEPPPHATVYYRGTDPQVGRMTKYTVVVADGHAG